MKTEIIRILKEQEGYLSGQELCERLQVSRTAVWKTINQLKEEGYQIEAVRNRGYRLVESPDVMTEAELRSCFLEAGLSDLSVRCYEELDSTNNQAKRLAEEGAPAGTLVTAESQTAGKGRRGRGWISPAGSGVWMSLILRPRIEPSAASMLTLVAALAVSSGIEDVCGQKVQIKWPNDIVINGKKICGILTEMSTEVTEIQYVVVGIGIIVNFPGFPEELRESATSIFLETGRPWRRGPMIAAVIKRFYEYYRIFLRTGDLTLLRADYLTRLANLDRQVTVIRTDRSYDGVCRGINDSGELLVECADGTVNTVLSGEVSVRGIYGYV